MKIVLQHIAKKFSDSFAIRDLNLEISDREFTTLLGPSGCGKTTILRMIAGLETPDDGKIWFDGRCVFCAEKRLNIPPEKRNLGFVFQDFALWPHMTVYENVAFPLRAKKQTRRLDEEVRQALASTRLDGFEKRYPSQLSGGQQQRVAFARAIVGNPSCILFDEPLSALDAILREQMRQEMREVTRKLGATAVFVTHDQTEAMSMSDQIVVLRDGHIEQKDTPEELYHHPKTRFAAGFIGKSNWFDENRKMVRPEAVHVRPEGKNLVPIDSKVIGVQFLGSVYELKLDVEGREWTVRTEKRLSPGENCRLYVDESQILKFA